MSVWMSRWKRTGLQLFNSSPLLRLQPSVWNLSATYTRKSAEEKLGLEKPKRPLTAFLKFVNQIRPTLVSKNPASSPSTIVKLASQHWQQLSDDVKQKLSKEYEKDVEKYRKSMQEFQASLSEEQKIDIKRLQREMAAAKEKKKYKIELKQLGKPKRPMTSFFLYCQDQRKLITGLSFVDFQVKMKEKWYALSEKEKEVWSNKANTLKEEYRYDLSILVNYFQGVVISTCAVCLCVLG